MPKRLIPHLKAMSKYTNIPSELKNFFSEKRKSSIMDMFSNLLVSLRFDNRSLGGNKRSNCQLVFYSFMAQDHINWRRLIYRMSVTLVSSVTCRKDFKKSHLPAVLIYFMCYNYDHLLDYRKILINTKTPDFTFLDVKSGVCFVKY